jgi:hypothetical protein
VATVRRKVWDPTDERDPGHRLVGDGEQGTGDVLVEHAGLVDEHQVAGEQSRLYQGRSRSARSRGSRLDPRAQFRQ